MGTATSAGETDGETPELDECYCSSCGSIIKEKAEICPDCGVRTGTSAATESKSTLGKAGYTALGIATGLISLLFVPIVFGPISMFSGYKVYKNHSEGHGIGLVIFGGVAMVMGMILGMAAVS